MSEDPFARFRPTAPTNTDPDQPAPDSVADTAAPEVRKAATTASVDPLARIRATPPKNEEPVPEPDSTTPDASRDAFERFKSSAAGEGLDPQPPKSPLASHGTAARTAAFDKFKSQVAQTAPASDATPPPTPAAHDADESIEATRRAFDRFRAAEPGAGQPFPASEAGATGNGFARFRAQPPAGSPARPATSSAPPATPAAPSAPQAPNSPDVFSLDLDAPSTSAHAPSPVQSPAPVPAAPLPEFSLDLNLDRPAPGPVDPATAPAAILTAGVARHAALPNTLHDFPTLPVDTTTILGHGVPPVIVLDRVQSAVGAVRFRLDTTERLRLSCVYETTDGTTLVARTGDPNPVPIIALAQAGQVTVNLRAIGRIKRFLVVVHAASPETRWTGAVIAEVGEGSTHLQFPIEHPTSQESLALATGFVVDGRLALRAERDHTDLPLRGICERYGFANLTWRDERTPINPV